mmetsp:Transcript_22051/g.30999  ORF Transcript_22051/g.30999 Transcript_22051/m.30999 type:complete len:85 (+) Transcript_22051:241-495(+)
MISDLELLLLTSSHDNIHNHHLLSFESTQTILSPPTTSICPSAQKLTSIPIFLGHKLHYPQRNGPSSCLSLSDQTFPPTIPLGR